MGIKIKKIHIKPGTNLLEGVVADTFMMGEWEKKGIDDEGWAWCKIIYVGFDYESQVLWVYLDEYWPQSNVMKIIPHLPENLSPDVECSEPFYLIEPDEGLIGYDITDVNPWSKDPMIRSIIWSEYVGEIRFKPIN